MRRRLVAGGLVMLLLLGMAGLSLFALDRSRRDMLQAAEQQAQLQRGLETAQQAQIAFKRQVQEWKNILLRSEAPESRPALLAAFQAQQQRTAALLQAVARLAPELARPVPLAGGPPIPPALPGPAPLSTDLPATLLRTHAALGERYAAALAAGDLAAPRGAAAIDAAVRGADRALEADLDALAARLAQHAAETGALLRAHLEARQAGMRRFLLLACGAGLLLALGLLVALSRRADGPR